MKNRAQKKWTDRLTVHQADEALFDCIDATINKSDPSLSGKLPVHEAPKGSWDIISKKIDQKRSAKRFYIYFAPLAAAASIALFVFLHKPAHQGVNSEIVYSFEYSSADSTTYALQPDLFSIDNLGELCNSYPTICSSNDYSVLQQHINRMNEELQQLENLGQQQGSAQTDPYKMRLKADIQKAESQLVKLFM